LTVAINGTGASQWIASAGTWSQLSSLNIAADTALNSLTVTGVNSTLQNVQATVPINGTRTAQVGQQGAMRLIRVWGAPTDVGVAPVTSTPSPTTNSTTNSPNTLTPSGEGEGEGAPAGLSTLATPAITTNQPSVTNRSTESIAPPLTGIESLLGSTLQRRVNQQTQAPSTLATDAVDAAMASISPSMRLQLSDDLEQSLASENGNHPSTNDSVLRAF